MKQERELSHQLYLWLSSKAFFPYSHLSSVCLKMHFGIILTCLKVCVSAVFIQPCRDSTPCGPVWEFSPTPRVLRCFGVLVFYRLPSLSSRQNPCGGQKGSILSLPCQRCSSCDNFNSFSVFEPAEPGRGRTQFCVILLTSSWRVSWRSSWSLLSPASDSSRWGGCGYKGYSPLPRLSTLSHPPMTGIQGPGDIKHNTILKGNLCSRV